MTTVDLGKGKTHPSAALHVRAATAQDAHDDSLRCRQSARLALANEERENGTREGTASEVSSEPSKSTVKTDRQSVHVLIPSVSQAYAFRVARFRLLPQLAPDRVTSRAAGDLDQPLLLYGSESLRGTIDMQGIYSLRQTEDLSNRSVAKVRQ